MTAGTVGSSSVVGYAIFQFSLAHGAALRPTVSGRDLDVSAGGEAGIDWSNIGSPTTVQNLSGTTISTGQTVSSVTQGVTLTTGERSSVALATWNTTRVSASNVGSFGQAVSGVINPVTVGTNNDKNGYALSVVGSSGVWDVVANEHSTAGTTGAQLLAAGAAGDPWSTLIPGAYGAGTAGNILGKGYLAGFGMTIGTVFGQIAGAEAAQHARN